MSEPAVSPARRRSHPLLSLIGARLREFWREPEAVFWVYGFPLIMAVGLGIAFWERKPEPAQVDVAEAPGADELRQRLERAGLVVTVQPLAECRQRLRTGKTALFIETTGRGFRYVYDEARPESLAARSEADAAILRW